MKRVFGPVPSRRLGQSLGIDPVPLKTCNWNCVYCQLGRTIPLINERKNFYPSEDIISEVRQALKEHKPGEIDWITFVGSGETTLHASIGLMIRQVQSITQLPVAVITNGSLLHLPDLRKELIAANAVLPSLDAGNPDLYRKINRPHPDITFERIKEGLITFGKEYQGKLWIEVMLIRGLNDSEQALIEIAEVLEKVKPDEVHIIQPTRPPVEPWVQPPDDDGLLWSRAILGNVAKVILPASGEFYLSGNENLVDAIVGIITRHPMKESELIESLEHFSKSDVIATLNQLEKSGKSQIVNRYGARFWSASPSYYPEGDKRNNTIDSAYENDQDGGDTGV